MPQLGVVGIQIQRAPEVSLGSRPVPVVVQPSQGTVSVSLGGLRVERQRAIYSCIQEVIRVLGGQDAEEEEVVIPSRETSVGGRVSRVEGHGLLKELHRAVQFEPIEVIDPPKVRLLRLCAYRTSACQPPMLAHAKMHFQLDRKSTRLNSS